MFFTLSLECSAAFEFQTELCPLGSSVDLKELDWMKSSCCLHLFNSFRSTGLGRWGMGELQPVLGTIGVHSGPVPLQILYGHWIEIFMKWNMISVCTSWNTLLF